MSHNIPKHLLTQVTEQINSALTMHDVVRIARIVGGYRMTRRNGALVATRTADFTDAERAWFRSPLSRDGGAL